MTVVGAEQLSASSPTTIATALNELPSFAGSQKPQSQASTTNSGGQNYLSLRNLGPSRTLVLLDGRRFVPSGGSGTTDVNLLPQALIQRVDVVTGGASAAYGSDAVSGVVNFVLDTRFTGVKGSVQSGISQRGDAQSLAASIAFGTGFSSGRGHLIGSVEYANDKGILAYDTDPVTDRGWNAVPYQVIPNPGGAPRFIRIPDARISVASWGGLVTSGPLRGLDFARDGTPTQFGYGQYANTLSQRMSGGNGPNILPRVGLLAPLERVVGFLHSDYDVTSDINVFAELSLAHTHSRYGSQYPYFLGNGLTIRRENPFLPDSVRARMVTAGVTTLPIGYYGRGLGIISPENTNNTWRTAFGAKGSFGGSWKWSVHGEGGQTTQIYRSRNNIVLSKFYQALDAVRNPGTGAIVCRSTLTNPSDGCVPLNILGEDSPSAAAKAYVHGDLYNRLRLSQRVAEAQVTGNLFNLPGGAVAVAAGVGYRKEKAVGVSDDVATGKNPITGFTGGYFLTNTQPLNGSYDTKEAFGEVLLPFFKDSALGHSLELNAAARYTDYSTSGGVTTWKIGATYEPTSEIRLRAARSRDIRAANIIELFTGPSQGFATVIDPVVGGISYNIQPFGLGNPNLAPERANTTTLGVVFQPEWLRGAMISVDAYDINISGAITTLTAQDTLTQCLAGSAVTCALITRDPTSGRITNLLQPRLNLASLKTRGLDFEAGYRTRIGTGDLSLRVLANYVDTFISSTAGGIAIDRAGDVGTPTGNTPNWRGQFTGIYSQGPFSLVVQERYVGSGKYNVLYTSKDLADEFNNIPSRFYTNLTARLRIDNRGGSRGSNSELFMTVNNLFDQAPPINPNNTISSTNTNLDLYDAVGRTFVVGFRFKY